MACYVERVLTASEVVSDIKHLLPDAGLRRRMSRVVKSAVATAVECLGGVENIAQLDGIITATGWGCLTDSERFLRNVIQNREQLLNPTPFIQSTFNTVGGQIALLMRHDCYNVTYVHRSHSFEDALLDAFLRISDGIGQNILVGAFDEQTPAQHRIMDRMGLFRRCQGGEGVVFAHLTATESERSVGKVAKLDFPAASLTDRKCLEIYASSEDTQLLYNVWKDYGLFPTASAYCFARAVRYIGEGVREVIVYNEYFGGTPTVIVLQCAGR